ncbi:MAG: class I SAM-dependent methyltransferase [Chloroflexota bacterium]|nr:class I SAM-dependent methyltransferase [Chloroflexota bacterium]
MKSSLLPLLRCPACHAPGLDPGAPGGAAGAADLTCAGCGRGYPVVDGVPELIAELDHATAHEREARAHKVYDPDYERARPYVEDASRPWLWPAFAANVEQGIGLLRGVRGPVLDVGPATCWSTRMLAERGHAAVAVDISTTMLRAGAAQHAAGVYFERVAGDMRNLPFQDGQFGAVFGSATVHHAEPLVDVFGEFRRVLRPGGRIVLVNEPVLGLFGRADEFGVEDIAHGMNEHVHRLWEYRRAAHAAGLWMRVLFPESLRRQMAGAAPSPSTAFAIAARALGLLPGRLQAGLLWPAHILVGLPLVALFWDNTGANRGTAPALEGSGSQRDWLNRATARCGRYQHGDEDTQ